MQVVLTSKMDVKFQQEKNMHSHSLSTTTLICEYMHVSSRRLVLHFVPWFDCSPSEINDIYVLIVPRLKRLEKDSYLRRKTFWSRVYEMDLQYICPNLIVALDTKTLPDKAKTTANIEL